MKESKTLSHYHILWNIFHRFDLLIHVDNPFERIYGSYPPYLPLTVCWGTYTPKWLSKKSIMLQFICKNHALSLWIILKDWFIQSVIRTATLACDEKKKKISICGSYLASFLAGTLKQEIIIVNADMSVLKQKLEKSHLYL